MRLMPLRNFRDVMPKGFQARALLILFVPILVLMAGMTWYYFDSHVRQVDTRLSRQVARDMALIAMMHDREPDFVARNFDAIADTQAFTLAAQPTCPEADARDRVGREVPTVRAALEQHLDRRWSLAFTGPNRDIMVCVPSGPDVLVFALERKRAIILNAHIFIVWVVGVGLLLTITAYAFLRNQVRSIRLLGEAARAFGRGREMPGFKPSGATEIRDTARAVLDMRDRLRAASDQRTAMLAAISHDLRTPLTRLKLQLALMEPTPDTQAARTDLAEMAQMLDEYLAFARGEEAEIATSTRIDVIVADIASHATPEGLTLTCTALPETTLTVRPLAVKRAVRNLVENALHHARSQVTLSLKPGPRAVDILIDDDGPGIAPSRHEEAFRPFVRLDPSRNQNVSGVGLGLALARDVARAHGGDIRLEVSPQGGLRACLRLPL